LSGFIGGARLLHVNAAETGLSVVVPACGRTAALERCLLALAVQNPVPGGLGVVVSIDGDDPSPAAVSALAPAGLDLLVVHARRTGPAGARNRGAVATRRELLAFIDDDCEPERGWAAALVAALERDPEALAGGPILNAYPRDASAAASHAVLVALYDTPPQEFLASANLALRRERFLALGGFDESFPTAAAEDRDLCVRAIESGMRVALVPGARVRHHRRSRPGELWRQHVEYGRGARRLADRRAAAGRDPVRAGPAFAPALARSVVRALREGGSPAVVPLVGLTQVASAWGYATGARRG
jgi:GT2 family glycosyltransferase